MIIMGIDSAMINCGYSVFRVSEDRDLTLKDTYKQMELLDKGCFTESDSETNIYIRMVRNSQKIHKKIKESRPDYIVMEDCISVGLNKSPTGLTVVSLILQPYLNFEGQIFKEDEKFHKPESFILITPERLQSLAHQERKTKPKIVVERVKSAFSHLDLKGISDHIADSIYLSYFGSRLINVYHKKIWGEDILSTQEKSIFYKAKTDVYKGRGKKREKVGEKNTGIYMSKSRFWWDCKNQIEIEVESK